MSDKSHSHHHSWQEVATSNFATRAIGGGEGDCSQYKDKIRVL